MSAWGLRLNPWGHSYSSLESEQMRFIHKAYCEAMEAGEEDMPIQLKMDDTFYPTYKPSVSDFDEHTFMRKMQDVVGLLRNPAEAIISTICAYQRERYERFTFNGYLNDPRTLLLEEFKDWAMRTLAPASCTTESILNEVRRRHAYVLRLQHGQQGLFQSGTGERSFMGTLKDVRNVIETRVLPSIEAERAHSSAREQLHTLEARGTDGLMHGVQFLFYVLRNTPNTPADCTISNLRAQQHQGMKDAMQTKSGQMLQLLLSTPSFKQLFPETGTTSQRSETVAPLMLTAAEEEEMVSTAVFCDSEAKPKIPNALTRTSRNTEITITPADFLSGSNSGVVTLRPESATVAAESFTRLHGLLKLLADLLVSCRKARQLAGPGGDLLVYGPGGEEVRRLMQSLEIVQSEISRLISKMTQLGVRELDRLKPNQEKAWRYSFSKVLPLENYLAHDFGACAEPIQRIYANADPLHVQKMYKQFRQATGMWVQENNSICRNTYAALGAQFVERLPSTRSYELEDATPTSSPQIELIEEEEESSNDRAKKTPPSSGNGKVLMLENGSGTENQPANANVEETTLALVPRGSGTAPQQGEAGGLSLFSTAASVMTWISMSKPKTDSSSSKTSAVKDATQSPQNSETDEEDVVEKAPLSSASSVSSVASNSAAQAQGVLDVLLLVRQSIQKIGQLSWGLRTSFHTSNIDEGNFDAFVVLCSIYEPVGVQCASDLLIRVRNHRTRLAQLLKRHIKSVLSCVLVLQGRILEEQKSIPGMSLVYRHLESVLHDFDMEMDALLTNFKQMMVECSKMKDGILQMPLLHQKDDNTGVSAAMFAYNSINALRTRVSGQTDTPSAAILTHGEYMRQISSQMDLHWNSISHLLQSLKGVSEAVGSVTSRLREFPKDSRIAVPAQQLDYIFEYNYDGFFRQSTKDLELLSSTFDGN